MTKLHTANRQTPGSFTICSAADPPGVGDQPKSAARTLMIFDDFDLQIVTGERGVLLGPGGSVSTLIPHTSTVP